MEEPESLNHATEESHSHKEPLIGQPHEQKEISTMWSIAILDFMYFGS